MAEFVGIRYACGDSAALSMKLVGMLLTPYFLPVCHFKGTVYAIGYSLKDLISDSASEPLSSDIASRTKPLSLYLLNIIFRSGIDCLGRHTLPKTQSLLPCLHLREDYLVSVDIAEVKSCVLLPSTALYVYCMRLQRR